MRSTAMVETVTSIKEELAEGKICNDRQAIQAEEVQIF